MRKPGGHNDVDPEWSVTAVLTRLAEDIGLKFSTVKSARWTSSRWPVDRRRKGVSFTVHRILAYEERFAAILVLPEGKLRWTVDDASRRVGNRVETPVTPKEKISAIHTLAQDDQVAAAVTSDFLKRPKDSRRSTSRTAAAAPGAWRRSGSPTSSTSSSTCRSTPNSTRPPDHQWSWDRIRGRPDLHTRAPCSTPSWAPPVTARRSRARSP